MKNRLEAIAKEYRTNIRVEELADKVYYEISKENSDAGILNDKYLLIDGVSYCFRRKNNQWTVQTW